MNASTNSKMSYLNVNIKGLNGRCHPALYGVSTTKKVAKLHAHVKLLCCDLYTYQMKAEYLGGSPHCRLCQEPSENNENVESLSHILSECRQYSEVRTRILQEMEQLCEVSKSGIDLKVIKENSTYLTQFLLDCTSINLPMRINEKDPICSELFNLSRDFCYYVKKTRWSKLKDLESRRE